MQAVHPALEDIEELSASIKNEKMWSREIAVFLYDQNKKVGLMKRRYGEIGESIVLVVCSPEYLLFNPDNWEQDEVNKFYVQESYNSQKVRKYIKSKIDEIGTVSIELLYSKLNHYFILDPKEWP